MKLVSAVGYVENFAPYFENYKCIILCYCVGKCS